MAPITGATKIMENMREDHEDQRSNIKESQVGDSMHSKSRNFKDPMFQTGDHFSKIPCSKTGAFERTHTCYVRDMYAWSCFERARMLFRTAFETLNQIPHFYVPPGVLRARARARARVCECVYTRRSH